MKTTANAHTGQNRYGQSMTAKIETKAYRSYRNVAILYGLVPRTKKPWQGQGPHTGVAQNRTIRAATSYIHWSKCIPMKSCLKQGPTYGYESKWKHDIIQGSYIHIDHREIAT